MNLNKVMLIGNLTRDPESKSTSTGRTVTTFTVATNRVWNDQAGQKQQKTEFHNIVAWGKIADICAQYLKKGMNVYVEGRLETRSWDGQDGVKRYKTEVVLDNMQMGPRVGGAQSSSYNKKTEENEPEEPMTDEDEVKIEDIPF
ncbi:single-stranded DNA-binding protein [Candidatus Azambacteria bacterium]|nr:single-stranded DNA-binding protein [Candidatus Azambacteria bacterium]